VSVVASPEPGWTVDDLADDFARCARWTVESGADCIEANFSCPNVDSPDGQLYQRPGDAVLVAARLREAVGRTPLLVKIGHVTDEHLAADLVTVLAPHVEALVMVNCIAAHVAEPGGALLFGGQRRGIAGDAIRAACVEQVGLFGRVVRASGAALRLVGAGGIAAAGHVGQFLGAGAHAVQLATAVMRDPGVGIAIRHSLAAGGMSE
jgi:dihydroorotate dehydrogenase